MAAFQWSCKIAKIKSTAKLDWIVMDCPENILFN